MSYEYLRKMFAGAVLEIDDLFLLESFQIAYFPGWVPEREFAIALAARPEIKRFLVTRCPEVSEFIDSLIRKHAEPVDDAELARCNDTVVWTIADIIVYNKCPGVYDRLPFHNWDFAEVTSIVDLAGKIVIDCGSGTGRVALEAAQTAALVYAVEPVSRLRQFIRAKAQQKGVANLYVIDGFLHAIPFPDSFADVVITSHALAWDLEKELPEFDRVVKHPGVIIHRPGGPDGDRHDVLTSPPWSYEFSEYDGADGRNGRFWRKT